MPPHTGVWKTGLLAGLLTLLLAVLAYQSKSSVAAHFLPHIVFGSYDQGVTRISTIIQISNVESTPGVSAGFFDEAGAPSRVVMGLTGGTPTTFSGSVSNVVLPPHGSLAISADTAQNYAAYWGTITASKDVLISTLVELRGATGEVPSRVVLDVADSNMRRFSIPRLHDSKGLDTGFAIVNTGSMPATLVATLHNAEGIVLKTKTREFAGHQHVGSFAKEYFELAEELSPGPDYQYITFDSKSAQFVAVAFGIQGAHDDSAPRPQCPIGDVRSQT